MSKAKYDLCFAKRPAEELYDLSKDPEQLNNLASDPAYAAEKSGWRPSLRRSWLPVVIRAPWVVQARSITTRITGAVPAGRSVRFFLFLQGVEQELMITAEEMQVAECHYANGAECRRRGDQEHDHDLILHGLDR